MFLGASYFRAVAKGQIYGLSARGLSLKTADPKGEEFPDLHGFLDRAAGKGASSIVVHALARQRERRGAYRFTIRPGETTVYDVEATLFPRVDIEQVGHRAAHQHVLLRRRTTASASTTSVRRCTIPTGSRSGTGAASGCGGRCTIRPTCRSAAFVDNNPRGFGLMQRQRDFAPTTISRRATSGGRACGSSRSAIGAKARCSWSRFPTNDGDQRQHRRLLAAEATPTRAKGEYAFTYRIHWGGQIPSRSPLARVIATRIGAGQDEARLFVLEFAGENSKGVAPADIKATVSADKGEVRNVRVATEPGDRRTARELRARHRQARSRSSCARSCCAARTPSSEAGCIDGRLTSAAARAPICRPRRRSEMPVQSLRGAAATAPLLAPPRVDLARAAPSCSARRSRSRCSPPTRCISCSRSAGSRCWKPSSWCCSSILFAWIALSFAGTLGGLIALSHAATDALGVANAPPPTIDSRTALLLPTYNEEPDRVFARVQAITELVAETGMAVASTCSS